jgi:hypothetical protein
MQRLQAFVFGGCLAFALAACERKNDSTTGYERPADNRGQNAPNKPKENVGNEMSEGEQRVEKPVEQAPTIPAVPTGMGGGPTTSTPTAARELLAGAQCDRLKSCGAVAKGKSFETYDACVSARQTDLAKNWSLDKCSKIDSSRLETCLKSTRGLSCESKQAAMPSECSNNTLCATD